MENWIEESDVFQNVPKSQDAEGIKIIKDKTPIKWPQHLKVYSFVKEEYLTDFPPVSLYTIPEINGEMLA